MNAVGDRSASSWSCLQVELRAARTTSTSTCSHHSRTWASIDGVGAGYAGVAAVPVGGEVVDGAEIGVDGQFVAGGVVAGGLVFEVAGGAGAVAR